MSKSKTNQLKFSIQNLIDTPTVCDKSEKNNHALKQLLTTSESSISRPIPLLKPKLPHPCWPFLTQSMNKNLNANLPFNSSLIFLNKMNQVWEQIQRTQISPSIITTASSTTENDDVSDEDIYMDTSSSLQRHSNLVDDDDEIEDEDEEEDDDDEEEGECSTSTGEKHNTTSNSDETDKLKTYPCTHCGKVRFPRFLHLLFSNIFRYLLLNTISFDTCPFIPVFDHLSARLERQEEEEKKKSINLD